MRLSYTPPPGWDFATVGDLAKPEKGSIRIGPFGSALKKHEYSENGIRVLGIEDVHPNQFLSDRCKYIPDAKFCELRQYEVSDGDVLVTNMGTVGRACAVPAGTQRSIISSHLIKVSLNRSRADPNYLCWMLNYSPLVVAQIRAKSHGAIMAGFNSSLLKSIRIPLPPLAEQERIAGILDAANALRAKRREALAQLEILIQSTFLDMFGDPVTNPMGWDERPLGKLVQEGFRNGLSPSTKGSLDGEVLTLSAITRGRFDFAAKKIARFDHPPSPLQQLSTDTFLICRGNGNIRLVGTGAYPDRSSTRVCFPDTMISVAIDPRVLAAAYLQNVWRTRRVRRQIERGARTTNGTHKVNQRLLSSIVFAVPPVALQLRFAAIVESIEDQGTRQRAHLAELDTLFASLQSRAFRGDL